MTLETALMILAIILSVSVGGGLLWLGVWTGMKLGKGVWEIARDNEFTSRPDLRDPRTEDDRTV